MKTIDPINLLRISARVAVLCFVAALLAGHAFAAEFVEGKHYQMLQAERSEQPEIAVFFSAYCGPCYMIHQPLLVIAEKQGITLRAVPVRVGAKLDEDIQLATLTARRQGVEHEFVQALFERIHEQRQPPKSREDLSELIAQAGGCAETYRQHCDNLKFAAKELDRLSIEHNVRATPTIIVNGVAQVGLAELTSFAELESLIEYLSNA